MAKLNFSIKEKKELEGNSFIVTISDSPNQSGEYSCYIIDENSTKIYSDLNINHEILTNNLASKINSLGEVINYTGNLKELDEVTKKMIIIFVTEFNEKK
ncbi:MAG: hypothetical protein ACYC25_04205 [Paludibacter sp.]